MTRTIRECPLDVLIYVQMNSSFKCSYLIILIWLEINICEYNYYCRTFTIDIHIHML